MVCLLHASPESVMATIGRETYKSIYKGKLAAQNRLNHSNFQKRGAEHQH